jgi:chromosome segregation ATPase
MEREYAQLVGRCVPLEENLAGLQADKSRIDLDLTREEGRLDGLKTRMLDVEKRLAEAQRDVSLHMESMHHGEEKNAVAAERIKALRATTLRLEEERETLRRDRVRLEEEIESLRFRTGQLTEQEQDSSRDLEEPSGCQAGGAPGVERKNHRARP